MTPEKVIKVIESYRQLFMERKIGKIDYPDDKITNGEMCSLEHCHSMLDKMIDFVHEERMNKVFRWLGFIQGVLWVNRIFTLSDLKNHNRSPEGGK